MNAPFPWFGGKRRVAGIVWERFGRLDAYLEPFAGSLAVLLGRPDVRGAEIVNDLDCYVANFWRALQRDPEAVAWLADYPVNEADLIARHRWLVSQTAFRERIRTDPDWCDLKVAAWWVWGISQWIGSGYCDLAHPAPQRKLPHLLAGGGVHRKFSADAGDCLEVWFRELGARLRNVRVACGGWTRILSDVVLTSGTVGIFLDPPYSQGEHSVAYASQESEDVAPQVRSWAIEHGSHPSLRIALCGYSGEHQMPGDWTEVAWKAVGGYGNRANGRGRQNADRERIWFSPGCCAPVGGLLDGL